MVVTVPKLFEGTLRIFHGDPSAFLRPWALVLKMFAIVLLSNFGFGTWSLIPSVAILYLPENAILHWTGGQQWDRL